MAERRAPAFRNLLSHQVGSTADVLRRGAALRMRREHDVNLAQVRTLSLIEHLQPVRLRDVAADTGSDKAQVSRVVSSLVSRGLISRHALQGDARSAHLELTDAGRIAVAAISKTAQERDRALRSCLRQDEADQLAALLARVRQRAQELVDEEERIDQHRARPQPD
jgi:DNA-binding MarR family transcriptional regulator